MKYILLIILFLLLMYVGIWVFNHVHAWLGIGVIIATLIGTFFYAKNEVTKIQF